MEITVFGRGCATCNNTIQRIEAEAKSLGVPVDVSKVSDDVEIIKAGVMTTPAVMIGGKIVHAGGIPSAEAVRGWLK
ncbi:MAG TPA: thioredoxin family protein [Alphaproteobacteria bacterium]|nr:thioredoxin family protein [Alphaproteobacteria bacterium]HNS43870.1 thioredoxin family protein [Alphaproteobacteria bacterium]